MAIFPRILNYLFEIDTKNMSAPTMTSIACDSVMDRALGHGPQTSGGRGKSSYAALENMPKWKRERALREQQLSAEAAKKTQQAASNAHKETVKKMLAGELDYM